MTVHRPGPTPSLVDLQVADGRFAMLALDQRESLRRMFPVVDGEEVGDETLRAFKRAAIAELSPHASAVLLDRVFAVGNVRPPELAADAALIVAADVLVQPAGMPVVTTHLDPGVTPEYIAQVQADAIKLLVIWYEGGDVAERESLVRDFLAVADAAGVASLVEGIVRPAEGTQWRDAAHRHDAIVAAAQELSGYGGTIYKAEVPGYVEGDLSRVRIESERLTAVLDVPWVVLSNGVAAAEFPDALAEAMAGGASGFLAGRAVWSDTVAEVDPAEALRARSRDRLQRLGSIVSGASTS